MAATAPVLAVLLCRGGGQRLPRLLSALAELAVRPERVIAVHPQNCSATAELLEKAQADELIDEVVPLADLDEPLAGVDSALRAADAVPSWSWLLTEDSVPEPDCLAELLRAAEEHPDAAMLGPLGLDLGDPRFVTDAGLSSDTCGRRRTCLRPSELDPAVTGAPVAVTGVLAVPAAGALLRTSVFSELGGFDGTTDAEVDLGWRMNSAGHRVLVVPTARLLRSGPPRGPAARRAELRTFLLNAAPLAFAAGIARFLLLSLLRAARGAALRQWRAAAAELALAGNLLTGRLRLRAARRARRAAAPDRRSVRGLLVGRAALLRLGLQRALARFLHQRIEQDLRSGREPAAQLVPAEPPRTTRTGPELRRGRPGVGGPVPVVVAAPEEVDAPRAKPAPAPAGPGPLWLVRVDGRRALRELLLAPPVLLVVLLVGFALLVNSARLGADLAGGRLLPVADLATTWQDYLAAWHPVHGGTTAPASPALLVLALAGTVLGGPAAVAAVVLLAHAPLAGLTAYLAARSLRARPVLRAAVAAAYAVLPAAVLSSGEGRLDVAVPHVLLPPLLAGLAAVLGIGRSSDQWLSTACGTALGMAVLGAFSPQLLVLLVGLAVIGFVLTSGRPHQPRRRLAGLAAVVVLPVACLLPWPVTLLEHPQHLLHAFGARAAEPGAGPWLLALSPDGSPASWTGGVLVVAALAALAVAPSRRMLPGLVVAGAGLGAAAVVTSISAQPVSGGPSSPGWAGGPLVLAAAGLCWVCLAAGEPRRGVPRRIAVPAVVVGLAGLCIGGALAGKSGPLGPRPATPRLPGTALVVDPGPARLVPEGWPRFGADDLAPTSSAVAWSQRLDRQLRSGDPQQVRTALAAAAARGAEFVVVRDPGDVLRVAGDLVAEHGSTGDGRTALRLQRPGSPVALLGPDLARKARSEPAPDPRDRPLEVPADLPNVSVWVSDGGAGRALVLATENEPGWRAWVDGREAPLATAWGNQLAVPLPQRASEVRIGYTEAPRTALLVLQAAVVLFTAVAALPLRGRATGRR